MAIGERAVMAVGNDYSLVLLKDQGQPVEVVHAAEGSPLIPVPSGVFRSAPNSNAARLFQSFLFSVEAQQLFVASRISHFMRSLRSGQDERRYPQ
jgi:iron(III) transport system substrate-binding protein